MRHVIAAIALVLALGLSGPVVAGPFEDASTAYNRGDYATTLRIVRPLADQGNAFAQSGLGTMYANGEGVPQDYAEAARWNRKAERTGQRQDWFVDASVCRGQRRRKQDQSSLYRAASRDAEGGTAERPRSRGGES